MNNLIEFFEDSKNQFGEKPFLWEKKDSLFEALTYNQTHEKVETLACGFLAEGLKYGERVALLSEGRSYWLISELAVLFCGAINVPLSTKLEADNDLIFRLNHSESRFIVVSSSQLFKIRLVKESLKYAEKIFVIDHQDIDLMDGEFPIETLIEKGAAFKASHSEELQNRKREVTPDTIANITYTSGTTADPKGIMLSHLNYTANVRQAFSYIEIPSHYITLAVLPWDHAFAHTACLYAFMHKGAGVASVQPGKTPMETLKNFSTNMLEIQPHVLMSVPAIAKNFKKNIEKAIQSKGAFSWWLFSTGIRYAMWYNGLGNDKAKGIKKLTSPLYSLFNALIFNKIKTRFGGRLQFFIGGGALLDLDLQKFFYAIGVPMYQGYGLSEASPIISANTPNHHKLGSSGKTLDDMELKICDADGNELPVGEKGEIVIRGANVMKGYWKNEEATRTTIKDGWLYTGDMGSVDNEGYLYVWGRFKSLLISADGEKYSPEGIEEAINDHCKFIDNIVLFNNQNPYTVALAVPSRENVREWLRTHKKNIDSDDDLKEILNLIKQSIAHFKTGGKNVTQFPQRWLPTAIAIVPEAFSEENKLVNTTMKVVRSKVEEYFKAEIDHLYTPEGKDILNSKNVENLRTFLSR
jgi:long-chain acyl-CoA synthetase